jgi:hypothetical protein
MLCTNNDYGGGTDCRHRGQRLLALLLLMRWSGLSIKDAVTLERNHLDDHGALFLASCQDRSAGLCSTAARGSLLAPCPTLHQPCIFFLEW